MTEANPAHWLAFRRFPSAQVMAFHRAQMDSIRAFPPGRDVTHNAMGFFTDYDHHALGRDLDVIGWDSFPLGVLEQFYFSDDDRRRYARQGHPDIATFHHDLFRGCCTGERWTVPEQQPGRVNRARYTPPPRRYPAWSRSGRSKRSRTGPSLSVIPLAPGALRAGADGIHATPLEDQKALANLRRGRVSSGDELICGQTTRVGSNDHLGE